MKEATLWIAEFFSYYRQGYSPDTIKSLMYAGQQNPYSSIPAGSVDIKHCAEGE